MSCEISGFHGYVDKDSSLLACYAELISTQLPKFWRSTVKQSTLLRLFDPEDRHTYYVSLKF
jgi:hypothetical protein